MLKCIKKIGRKTSNSFYLNLKQRRVWETFRASSSYAQVCSSFLIICAWHCLCSDSLCIMSLLPQNTLYETLDSLERTGDPESLGLLLDEQGNILDWRCNVWKSKWGHWRRYDWSTPLSSSRPVVTRILLRADLRFVGRKRFLGVNTHTQKQKRPLDVHKHRPLSKW